MSSVKRRLTFVAWADGSKKAPFDPVAAAKTLVALDPGEVVLEHSEALTAVEVVDSGGDGRPTQLLVLALHGYDDRPLTYEPGQVTKAITIGEDQYTAWVSHVSIWSDKIAAYDMYAAGPGLSRLSSYLRDKADEKVRFLPLYEQDLAQRLADLDGVRAVDFSIHSPTRLARVGTGHGMFSDLVESVRAKKVPSVSVTVGVGRKSASDAYLDPEITDDVLDLAEKAEEFFDALVISGKSKAVLTARGKPKTVRINLLSQRLHVERDLPRIAGGGNLPEAAACFSAMDAARAQLDKTGALESAVDARLQLDASEDGD